MVNNPLITCASLTMSANGLSLGGSGVPALGAPWAAGEVAGCAAGEVAGWGCGCGCGCCAGTANAETRTIDKSNAIRVFMGVLLCGRSEEHTSELQSRLHLVCRLLLEKKKKKQKYNKNRTK